MLLNMPYFLTNKEWYIEVSDKPVFLEGKKQRRYKLTDKAPQKAIESYKQYYEMLEETTQK